MTTPPPIDDDHFEYEGGQRQCISGFGENAKGAALDLVNDGFNGEKYQALLWHIDELVRWCRGLNRELKETRATIEERNTIKCPRCGTLTVVDTKCGENCNECGIFIRYDVRYDVVPLNPGTNQK